MRHREPRRVRGTQLRQMIPVSSVEYRQDLLEQNMRREETVKDLIKQHQLGQILASNMESEDSLESQL